MMLSYSGQLFDLEGGDNRFTTGLDALLAEHEAEGIRKRIKRPPREHDRGQGPRASPRRLQDCSRPGHRKIDGSRRRSVASPVAKAVRRMLDGHSFDSVVRWIETRDPLGWPQRSCAESWSLYTDGKVSRAEVDRTLFLPADNFDARALAIANIRSGAAPGSFGITPAGVRI
ncbi:hypothetical protein [Rhodococcus sp. PAMC28707]|nr:hypothetical protein [Rhodococcus sp. PAMC28707]